MADQTTAPLWETSKENAAPLERGRNVAVLERSFAAETASNRDEQNRMIHHYETLVRSYEQDVHHGNQTTAGDDSEDPLIHWLSYIKYHQETFPQDTHEQFLLLERCFRSMHKLRRYADDARFLRVCCMYAEKTSRAMEIFRYLYKQPIGTHTAIFYAAWAWKAEKEKDFNMADKIFMKGISKEAQPIRVLQRRHKQFQRRMSRYFLNSVTHDDDDEEGDDSERRGALGRLQDDALHRNDRSASVAGTSRTTGAGTLATSPSTSFRTFTDRSAVSRHGRGNGNENNLPTSAGFAIYADDADGNGEASLFDDSFVTENDRQLETEEDRLKENTAARERWNQRGGLRNPTFESRATSSHHQTPAFAVFVDEECAAQHERQENERQHQEERHRRHRDERTFREREDAGAAERLAKDPLRYVRDTSMVRADRIENQPSDQGSKSRRSNLSKRKKVHTVSNASFNSKLLVSASGNERCFEEARAHARYYSLAPDASNLNILKSTVEDSSMEVDGSIEEVSMEESVGRIPLVPARKLAAITSGKKLPFRPTREASMLDSSTDRVTPRNASAASSTVDDAIAVGAPTGKEEHTINTQWAIKELSMMFSSPAVAGGIETKLVNHSGGLGPIANQSQGSETEESMCDGSKGDTACLQDVANVLGDPRMIDEINVIDKCNLRTSGAHMTDKRTGLGMSLDVSQQGAHFQIYRDSEPDTTSAGFTGEIERGTIDGGHTSRFMHTFEGTADATSVASVDDNRESIRCYEGNGDTASLSMLGDALGGFRIGLEDKGCGDDGAGDHTVDLPAVGDSDIISSSEVRGRSSSASDLPAFGDVSCIVSTDDIATTRGFALQKAIDYLPLHESDVKRSLERMRSKAQSSMPRAACLSDVLSRSGLVYDCPTDVIPRLFKQEALPRGREIIIGRCSASIQNELGRGAYGVVALLDRKVGDCSVAVKVQKPTGCLAWEYELLRKIEERTGGRFEDGLSQFPRALSFASLADGAMIGMTAASKSGLNLVDLVNVYQVRVGESVPEIIALHYTSRMLHALEVLHWHGKVLHCDTKPDNWALSTVVNSRGSESRFEGSDLMLVDFGRAVDLEAAKRPGVSAMETRFRGDATSRNMMCAAMRLGRPWSFDIDTFGVCASAHVLIAGSHLEIELNASTNKWTPKSSFPPTFHRDLWNDLFDSLLNIDEISQTAIGSHPQHVRQLRGRLDAHIETRKDELQSALHRQESILPRGRSDL